MRINRKIRLGLVFALAIVAAVIAWRTSENKGAKPCVEGRQEEKDSAGNVTRITRTYCR